MNETHFQWKSSDFAQEVPDFPLDIPVCLALIRRVFNVFFEVWRSCHIVDNRSSPIRPKLRNQRALVEAPINLKFKSRLLGPDRPFCIQIIQSGPNERFKHVQIDIRQLVNI